MIKPFRFLPHLPLGVVFAAGGLVLGLSEEPSAHGADDLAVGVIRTANPDTVLSPDMLSSAVDAALMRARVNPETPTATELRHTDMTDLTGLSAARTAPTLAHLDQSIAQWPLTTLSDMAATGLLSGATSVTAAPGSGDAGVSGLTETLESVAQPASADSEQVRNIADWLARYYRADRAKVVRYVNYAFEAGQKHSLDPMLIIAVMSIESSLNPKARSHKDARGLMQVLVAAHKEKFAPYGGIASAYKPRVSVDVGSIILKGMIERTGSVEKALKHYVGAANLRTDSGYGAKVIRARDRIYSAAHGQKILTRPNLVEATRRANQAQQAMAERVGVLASNDS